MHVFLSPHYDDAVLSCGGTIHQLTQSGQAAQILTVMGGESAWIPDSPIIREVHARWQAGDNPVPARRQEDRLAADRLGAAAAHSSLPDCIYRAIERTNFPCYPTGEAIFGEIHPFDYAATSRSIVSATLLRDATGVYAPLGAGHHVDHQIVRNFAIAMKRENPSLALKFYEEYPYIRDIMAAQRALDILAAIAPDLQLEREIVELREGDVQAKVKAIACYQTQISSFWPDLGAMEQDVRQTLTRTGDGLPAERYWRIVSSE